MVPVPSRAIPCCTAPPCVLLQDPAAAAAAPSGRGLIDAAYSVRLCPAALAHGAVPPRELTGSSCFPPEASSCTRIGKMALRRWGATPRANTSARLPACCTSLRPRPPSLAAGCPRRSKSVPCESSTAAPRRSSCAECRCQSLHGGSTCVKCTGRSYGRSPSRAIASTIRRRRRRPRPQGRRRLCSASSDGRLHRRLRRRRLRLRRRRP